MEILPRDYSKDIEYLEKMFNSLQQSIYFSITISISAIALSVAIAGLALYFLAKQWVDARVQKEMEILKADNANFKASINEKIVSILHEKKQIHFARGSILVQNGEIKIYGVLNFNTDNVILFQVFSKDGKRLNDNNYFIPKDQVGYMDVKIPDSQYENNQVYWDLIWENSKF